jgi:hypothetical protein
MRFIVFLLIVAISVGGYAANACAFGQVSGESSITSCHESFAQSEKETLHQKSVPKTLNAHVCCAPYIAPVTDVFSVSFSVLKVEKPRVDAKKHGEFVSPPFRPPSA